MTVPGTVPIIPEPPGAVVALEGTHGDERIVMQRAGNFRPTAAATRTAAARARAFLLGLGAGHS